MHNWNWKERTWVNYELMQSQIMLIHLNLLQQPCALKKSNSLTAPRCTEFALRNNFWMHSSNGCTVPSFVFIIISVNNSINNATREFINNYAHGPASQIWLKSKFKSLHKSRIRKPFNFFSLVFRVSWLVTLSITLHSFWRVLRFYLSSSSVLRCSVVAMTHVHMKFYI